MQSTARPAAAPVRVTVVESPACHLCEDAKRVLAEFASTHLLTVETLDVFSEPGLALMARHRAAMSPLVLVNGNFFSQGRLPRRKLAKLLTDLSPSTPLAQPTTAG